MKKHIIFLFLAVAPLVSGCSPDYDWIVCPEEVSVTVQMENQPVFSWDPECGALEFEVFVLHPGGVLRSRTVWELEARDGAPSINPAMFPPLTYSVKPEDIDQPTPAIPLKRGERYGVWVTSSIEFRRVLVGRTEFTYDP
jgi:hypothetical protein